MTVQDPSRGTMLTLHCPRCRTAAAPGTTDPMIECATCRLTYTADDGARTAPPNEITRTRAPKAPESTVSVTAIADTITIVAPTSRHLRVTAPIVAIGITMLVLWLITTVSEQSWISVVSVLMCGVTWYVAIGETSNVNRIVIDAHQVSARVRPAPVTRRRVVSLAAARHARTRSYDIRGTTFHCVLVDEDGRAIPLAYLSHTDDAVAVADAIRSHAGGEHLRLGNTSETSVMAG
jgi:hypothetical protein